MNFEKKTTTTTYNTSSSLLGLFQSLLNNLNKQTKNGFKTCLYQILASFQNSTFSDCVSKALVASS